MPRPTSRRQFVKQAAAAGAALPLGAWHWARAAGANSRLHVAAVGTAGQAWHDLTSVAKSPHVNVTALCDVDESAERLGRAADKFTQAKRFTDWRQLLDRAKDFDAVIVAIPDHMHAAVTLAALHQGKHVYCEKPLTHTVFEARQVRRAAAKANVVTQMGNQIQSFDCYRTAVRLVHDGAVGKVKEVHSWQAGKLGWRLTDDRPPGGDPIPAGLHWDEWLGTAPERPYKAHLYHSFNWRAWQDFSNGQLGDFGCHILDPVFMALGLTAPLTVRAVAPPINREVWTRWSRVSYLFPGTERTAGKTVRLTWYDGEGHYPPQEVLGLPDGYKLPQSGSALLGEQGTLVIPHFRTPKLFPEEKFADYRLPQLPKRDHYLSWADACRGEDKTTSPFAYAGPLSETVRLGTVAIRVPNTTLTWDAEGLKIPNSTAANALLTKAYRKGWEPAWA
jgi:predicted dehydrogenase